jgi:CYTH domain-containing protein
MGTLNQRKYLISQDLFSSKFPYQHVTYIDKAYILLRDNAEIKLHRNNDSYYYTMTHSLRFTSEQIEELTLPLSRLEFDRLSVPGAPMVKKAEYAVAEWYIIRYMPPHFGVALAWIILEENEEPPMYEWLKPHVIKEVTDDPHFTDKQLALKGLPSYI